MAGFRACGIAVMSWWACAVVTHAMERVLPSEPEERAPSEDSLDRFTAELERPPEPVEPVESPVPPQPVEPVPPQPVEVLESPAPPQPVESLEAEELPERAERPVAPSSCSSEESTSEAEAEALRAEARRREEAIEQEVETRLAAAHQAGEALPDVLRILLELQTQTRRMDDNHRELMGRVLNLNLQTAQTATSEKSDPTARRPPRPRCATCLACTFAPPPGTRRAPCESWRTSAAPSTPAPRSAPKTPRGRRQNDSLGEVQAHRNVIAAALRKMGDPDDGAVVMEISGETYTYASRDWQLFRGSEILESAFEQREDRLCVVRQLSELLRLPYEEVYSDFDAICPKNWKRKGVTATEIREFCVWLFIVNCRGQMLD